VIKLVVALGNPGKEYQETRHNIAWMALDTISFNKELIWKNKFKGFYSTYKIKEQKIFFLKPQTYMNLSGESVAELTHFYKINVDEILIIHDEMDFSFGQLAFKIGGGLAGHNGLKSIVNNLGSEGFNRLRLGVSRSTNMSSADWVLSKFSQEEIKNLDKFLIFCAQAIEASLQQKVASIFNIYNKKSFNDDIRN